MLSAEGEEGIVGSWQGRKRVGSWLEKMDPSLHSG